MTNENNKIHYSVVIPVFNEEEVLNELYERLTKVMTALREYEIVFIDDGSRDKSFEILKSLHEQDRRVKVVKFSRNFGHHIAITAGLDFAKGDAIILMDSDLQDPPEEILKLSEKFQQGYDIVYAIRQSREDPLLKRICAYLFYKLFKIFGKIELPQNTGVFRIISRRVVEHLHSCGEKSRFITGLISWTGLSSIGIEIKRDERYAGQSKYNFLKSAKLAANAIISFSTFPLHIVSIAGFIIATVSFIFGICMLARKLFFGMAASGYASIIVSIFFLGGVQLMMIGAIGEYIGKIYTEVQNRPLYVIKEQL